MSPCIIFDLKLWLIHSCFYLNCIPPTLFYKHNISLLHLLALLDTWRILFPMFLVFPHPSLLLFLSVCLSQWEREIKPVSLNHCICCHALSYCSLWLYTSTCWGNEREREKRERERERVCVCVCVGGGERVYIVSISSYFLNLCNIDSSLNIFSSSWKITPNFVNIITQQMNFKFVWNCEYF